MKDENDERKGRRWKEAWQRSQPPGGHLDVGGKQCKLKAEAILASAIANEGHQHFQKRISAWKWVSFGFASPCAEPTPTDRPTDRRRLVDIMENFSSERTEAKREPHNRTLLMNFSGIQFRLSKNSILFELCRLCSHLFALAYNLPKNMIDHQSHYSETPSRKKAKRKPFRNDERVSSA